MTKTKGVFKKRQFHGNRLLKACRPIIECANNANLFNLQPRPTTSEPRPEKTVTPPSATRKNYSKVMREISMHSLKVKPTILL